MYIACLYNTSQCKVLCVTVHPAGNSSVDWKTWGDCHWSQATTAAGKVLRTHLSRLCSRVLIIISIVYFGFYSAAIFGLHIACICTQLWASYKLLSNDVKSRHTASQDPPTDTVQWSSNSHSAGDHVPAMHIGLKRRRRRVKERGVG